MKNKPKPAGVVHTILDVAAEMFTFFGCLAVIYGILWCVFWITNGI